MTSILITVVAITVVTGILIWLLGDKRRTYRRRSTGRSRYVTKATKAAVIRRDGRWCRMCGSTHRLEFDHKIPFSWGGGNGPDNIQILCEYHNLQKGNRWAG